MQPSRAYQQRAARMSRIDTILGLYDQALAKIDQAGQALADGNAAGARVNANKAKLALSGLVCAIQGNADELSLNLLRLYEFVAHNLAELRPDSLAAARQILRTLREGFDAIRDEALRLEREGVLPPLDRSHTLRTLA